MGRTEQSKTAKGELQYIDSTQRVWQWKGRIERDLRGISLFTQMSEVYYWVGFL